MAAAIVRRSVPSTPVMDELRRQGKQQCQERRANLPYARPESESEESVERVSRVLVTWHVLSVVQTYH